MTQNEALAPPLAPFGEEVRDIAMRHTGSLYGYSVDLQDGDPNDDDAGHFIEINWEDGTSTDLGDDGIATFQQAFDPDLMACDPMQIEMSDVGVHPEALTFSYFGGQHRGWVVGNREPADPPQPSPPCGVTNERNILYLVNPDTGVAISDPAADRPQDPMAMFPMPVATGTQIVERGVINTLAQGNGTITGIAVIPDNQGNQMMFAVSDTGALYRINDPLAPEQGTGLAQFVGYVQGRPSFAGLTAGPANVEGGAYQSMLFGIDDTGMLHAFNDRGIRQPVFFNGTSQIDTGVAGANGLAFSTLDYNLWHETDLRATDAGHGSDPAADFTRCDGSCELPAEWWHQLLLWLRESRGQRPTRGSEPGTGQPA